MGMHLILLILNLKIIWDVSAAEFDLNFKLVCRIMILVFVIIFTLQSVDVLRRDASFVDDDGWRCSSL